MGLKVIKETGVFLIFLLLISCSGETDAVEEGSNTAGFIRTLDFVNSDLILDDVASTFGVNLEVNDGVDGALLENVEVFARLKRNPLDDLNNASQEALVKTLAKENFTPGLDGLRALLSLTYSELVNATNVDNLQCGNQFLIRLQLNLSNGKSFSTDEGNSSSIIGFDTFFSSPFCYTINIVDPIPDDKFVGFYSYESIADGAIGSTFGPSKVIEVIKGDSANERYFLGDYIASRPNEPSRKFKFVFTCDQVLFRKNQISSFFTWCDNGVLADGLRFGGPPILLGPGDEIGAVSMNTDRFFELSIAEGYEGWDGECNFGTINAKVRFTKME